MTRSDFVIGPCFLMLLFDASQAVASASRKIKEKLNPKVIRSTEGKTINVIGDIQTIKLTGKDTDGRFTLIGEENAPGTGIHLVGDSINSLQS